MALMHTCIKGDFFVLKKVGLKAVFLVAASAAFTMSTGLLQIHEPMVLAGEFIGEALGWPVFAENFGENAATFFETGEYNFFAERGIDPHAGHNHGPVETVDDLFADLGQDFNGANPPACENLHYHGDEPHCGIDPIPDNNAPIPFKS